jgi:hypothetical protein
VSNLLNRFSLHATDWNGWVGGALVMIWACVVACVISSILAQPFQRGQRAFWIATVILLPVLGILAYLPFAFRKENLPHIFLRHSKHPRKDRSPESEMEP